VRKGFYSLRHSDELEGHSQHACLVTSVKLVTPGVIPKKRPKHLTGVFHEVAIIHFSPLHPFLRAFSQ
jgi:hypothetical protein